MKNYPFYSWGLTFLLILIPALMISGCAAQWDVTRADVLFREGMAEAGKGEYQQAIASMEESARIYEKAGNLRKAGQVYRYVSGYSRQRGNLQKALDYAQKSLDMQKQVPDNELWLSGAYLALGRIYYILGEGDKSNEYLQQASSQAEAVIKAKGRDWWMAQKFFVWANLFIGDNYRGLKNCQRALEYHLKALEAAEELRYPRGKHRMGTVGPVALSTLAVAGDYKCLKQGKEAEEYYNTALRYAPGFRNKHFEAELYRGLGDLYFYFPRLYDKDKALALYQKSLEVSQKYQLANHELWTQQRLGAYYRKLGDVASAIHYYKKSIEILESMRGGLKAGELKTTFLENKLFIYEELILLLLEQKQEEEAFNYVERARSRALLDMLGLRVRLGKAHDADLNRKEKELNRQMEELLDKTTPREEKPEEEAGPGDESSPVSPDTGQEKANLQTQYQLYLTQLKQKDPEGASLVSVDPLTLPQIQALTGGEFTLLEYYVTEGETLLWVMDKDSSKLVRISVSRQELEAKVEFFRNLIIKRAENRKLQPSSQELYALLVAPALSYVKSKTLCLVPHGVLHYLPFQALQNKEGQYLVQDHTLFYASSASVLKFTFQKRRESINKLLALGNPDLGSPTFALPFAEEEVKNIAQYFPQKEVLVRKEATKKRTKDDAPAYDLIHFACHGELQEFSPMFSALLLAPTDKGQDGRLEVQEIFNLDLKASLVTLSACQTGLGKLKTGDELIGLNRAFIYAGTPAVMASLWAVEDRSTYLLMSKFYQHLKTQPKAEALRTAQLEVAKEYPQPFFWAAFTLSGDWK